MDAGVGTGRADVGVDLHRHRLVGVVADDVLHHLAGGQRLVVLVAADHPDPWDLVVLVVGDGEVVGPRLDDVGGGFGRSGGCRSGGARGRVVVDQDVLVLVVVDVGVLVVVAAAAAILWRERCSRPGASAATAVGFRAAASVRSRCHDDLPVLVEDVEAVPDALVVFSLRQQRRDHPVVAFVAVFTAFESLPLHLQVCFERRDPVPARDVPGDEVLLVRWQVGFFLAGLGRGRPLPRRAPKDKLVSGPKEFLGRQHALFQKGGFRQLRVGPFAGAAEGSQDRCHCGWCVLW
mmetsp:Transcript_7622/g.18425  ORF Transcript_7622/g.18425 Transcript_7622/m.18425 type:complete len:291 (+) Transcript_7622:1003-1875(+)